MTDEVENKLNLIRQELDDHLQSINENTSEMQAFFDYLQEIELKIDKLTQRVEQSQLAESKMLAKPSVYSLTSIEKKVFLVLYT